MVEFYWGGGKPPPPPHQYASVYVYINQCILMLSFLCGIHVVILW